MVSDRVSHTHPHLHAYLCAEYSPQFCDEIFARVDARAEGREWPTRINAAGYIDQNPVGSAYNRRLRSNIYRAVLREAGVPEDDIDRYAP